MATEKKEPTNVIDAFLDGARSGWQIGTYSTLPNVFMAFAIIQILEITGLLALIGQVFEPIMVIFGLPGAAATALMAAFMSMGGGTGAAARLVVGGQLEVGRHVVILIPACYLMGSMVQYVGRVAGTIGIPPKYNAHMIIVSMISAFLCMFVMNIIV